jgi:lysozyme
MNFDMSTMEAELRRDEAEVLQVYDDSTGNLLKPGAFIKGNPTIGVGRNLLVGISEDESTYLLGNDIATAAAGLDQHYPWWENLDPVRQRVMVNMCFNLGITRLGTFVHFLAAMETGDWQTAAAEMQTSLWFGQVGERATRLQYMVLNGTTEPGAV